MIKGYVFEDVEPVATEIQKKINDVFKYENITVNVKRSHALYGQMQWVAKCSKKKSENCKFIINISRKQGERWARVNSIDATHSHAVQDMQNISGSNQRLIVAADLQEHEVACKAKIAATVEASLCLSALKKQICAELFGAACLIDRSAHSKFRLWTKHVVDDLSSTDVAVTRHCKDDNLVEYLTANYDYVVHENAIGTKETRFLFWSSKQQQELYRRFKDVIIIDGTAGKNAFNWCILLAVCINSEFKTQIIAQMLADSECKEAYAMMLKHLIISGNASGSTEFIPDIFLTDEDPGFISAYKDLQARYPTKSMAALRCHWHLMKDVTLHFACIHSENECVHALFKEALYKTTESAFEEAWTALLKSVETYKAVHRYLSETLYVNRHRWATYARMPLRTLKSDASGRVEGQNGILGEHCNRKTKLSECSRVLTEMTNKQLLNEVKHNGPERINASPATFVDGQFQLCLNAAIPLLSNFAYGQLREQMQQSLHYNCTLQQSLSEDNSILVYLVTPRQSCFTGTVDETKGRMVTVNKAEGTHTCCCMFEEDIAIPCRHYFTCMTHSRQCGLPFNMSMIPRRWYRKDKYETLHTDTTNLYVNNVKYDTYLEYNVVGSPALVTCNGHSSDQATDQVDEALWVQKEKTNLLYAVARIFDDVVCTKQTDGTHMEPSAARYTVEQSIKNSFPNMSSTLLTDDGINMVKRTKKTAGRPPGACGNKFGNKRIKSALESKDTVKKVPSVDAVKIALSMEKKEKAKEKRRLLKEGDDVVCDSSSTKSTEDSSSEL